MQSQEDIITVNLSAVQFAHVSLSIAQSILTGFMPTDVGEDIALALLASVGVDEDAARIKGPLEDLHYMPL